MSTIKISVIAGFTIMIGGCATQSNLATVSSDMRTDLRMTTKTVMQRRADDREWSSDRADLMVYPQTIGPVNSYRPIYKVKREKCEASGEGQTEKVAADNAIFAFCKQNECDYVTAAKQIVRSSQKDGRPHFEVVIKGFPVVLVDVEEVVPEFYEQQQDGSLTKMDKMVDRYVLNRYEQGQCDKWTHATFYTDHGENVEDIKEKDDVVSEQKVVSKRVELNEQKSRAATIIRSASGTKPGFQN